MASGRGPSLPLDQPQLHHPRRHVRWAWLFKVRQVDAADGLACLRVQVAPRMDGHHWITAGSQRAAAAVRMP